MVPLKNRLKNGQNWMHWNVPPDALSGSATYVRVLDRWLMDYIKELHHEHKHEKARGKAWFTQGGVEKHNFTG